MLYARLYKYMTEMGFWKKIKEKSVLTGVPILAMAPMADVTDSAFRYIIAKYSKPKNPDPARPISGGYVTWTEFVSADGLILGGYDKLVRDLQYDEIERPIVAQVFTSKPDIMEKVAKLIVKLGFDGLDINMGCPDRSIEKQGAGASLMKNPKLALELIESAKKGVAGKIPVSVKTRLGYNKNEIDSPAGGWLRALLSAKPAVITIHARTRKEMSKVPARWEEIKKAVEIRDALKSKTLILGNGDVESVADAIKKCKESGADGAMIGRGMFGNPLIYSGVAREEIPIKDRLAMLVEHTKLFSEKFCVPENVYPIKSSTTVEGAKGAFNWVKSFAIMKKHYKAYCEGFDGAKELRMKLMEAKDADDVEKIVEEYLDSI